MQNKYPNIAVDVVLFSYFEKALNVLLIQRNVVPFVGQYALPGVFLKEDEMADDAALRALKDETNVQITKEKSKQFNSPRSNQFNLSKRCN